jgi:outer membrane translocation and assembly module TamA
MARFKPGQRFERSKIDDLRRALINTSLVSAADIRVVPAGDGRTVDLDVRLEPAPSHTIAGEIGYGTGEGARLEASWTDRNFFNPEGALTFRGIAGTSEQLAAVQFRLSNFLMRDQTLNLQASASHQKFDAYEAKTISLGGNIERQSNFIWQKKWTWTYGGEVLGTIERGVFDASGTKATHNFLIGAIPLSLGYDGSDSLLDPTTGFRLSGRLSPEISARNGHFTYARAQIDASAYRRVTENVVAAGRRRVRYRSVAAILFGWRRVGPRLRLSAAGAQGRRRRSDRRSWSCRVRARGADPPQAVRRQFRDRALLRRWITQHRGPSRLQGMALRGRYGRPLFLELRPDPHRRRRTAQPAEG